MTRPLMDEEAGRNVAVSGDCATDQGKNWGRLLGGIVMALLFRSSVDSEARWKPQLARLMPELEVRIWPAVGDPADIHYALVWQPEPGLLASLPNLKLILSLGAGVDHIFCDPHLPLYVPIVRLVDPYMTDAMSEYVVLQVLRLHRQDLDYRAQQEAHIWRELDQKNAAERPVGILGAGALGQDAGRKLKGLGFDVALWGRNEKVLEGLASYTGSDALPDLLGRSEILVCLLPLTTETQGILNNRTFALLPKGAALVNAARGGHLIEADLLAALACGQLSAAALDVFRDEPLPDGHPFWRHPRIVVTPHVAAATHPPTAAPLILDNIRRFEQGLPLLNQVDPARGY
jgi:glyoxylate/hydroxypyruvate reductase